MAPEVAVPANFGKHHLKSRTHNNLELLCAEGEVQRANSMILSLNSSVIEDLIARLEITSLDMQDFAAPAVNCFVESMFSGELENCDKTNFRDLNKMGHVFDVTWFVERCLKYFTELVDKVTGRCYEDIMFVAEEAWFVEVNLKKNVLMDLLTKKLGKLGNTKSIFLKEYAGDLDKLSINKVKMVVKIAGKEVGILTSILANHLENIGASTLSYTTRYLFENIDFVQCFVNRRYFDTAHFVIEKILNDSCNEEFKSAVKCIFNLAQPTVMKSKNKSDIYRYPAMVGMEMEDFLELEWDSLCDFLSQSEKVCNLYQFFDAIYMWLFMSKLDRSKPVPRIDLSDQHFVKDIIDIRNDRRWGKVFRKHIESTSLTCELGIGYMIESFSLSHDLSCENGTLFRSEQGYGIDKLFNSKNLTIPLLLWGQDKVAGCTENSKCGIMLKGFCEKDGKSVKNFELTIVQNVVDDRNDDIHYHNVLDSSQTFSLLMESGNQVTPIPFNSFPSCYGNGSWSWGFYEFSKDGKLNSSSSSPFRFVHTQKTDVLIEFIASLTS